MNRFASTRSEKRASQPGPGRAQWSVGSIDEDGIRYGLTTHALIASTIAIAPTIVTSQSMITRHARGIPSVRRSTGFLTNASSCGSARGARRRCARGRPRGARRARASRGTRRAACSAGTRARPRAPRRSSRARPSPRRGRPGAGGRRVEQHHRRQLAAGEDVRADRDRLGRQVLDDPLVEALEARGQDRQPLLGGQLLDERLVEHPPGGSEREHAMRRDARRRRRRARPRRRRRAAPSPRRRRRARRPPGRPGAGCSRGSRAASGRARYRAPRRAAAAPSSRRTRAGRA